MIEEFLLRVSNLSIAVKDDGKKIVEDVSLTIKKESITTLVGGSGSGKTTLGLSVLRLLSPALEIQRGEIIFNQKQLLTCSDAEIRCVRGREIAMIFQEPLYAFNPVFKIGQQIEEVLEVHSVFSKSQRREKVFEALKQVGMTDLQRAFESYPHQLSGGMRQRAMIAQAIVSGPSLLIADEPTSNLDVTLQAKIIELFRELRERLKLSILLITHDLGMVKHLADEVFVLNSGRVVEAGPVSSVMGNPRDSYTVQLMKALEI